MDSMPGAGRLDHRLILPGMQITVSGLVEVFVAHRPGNGPVCAACSHPYTDAAPSCGSYQVARDLLRKRYREDPGQVPWTVLKEIGLPPGVIPGRPVPVFLPPVEGPVAPAGVTLEQARAFGVEPGWRKTPRPRPPRAARPRKAVP